MKDRPSLRDLLEVQSYLGLPSPALVEKDWYVVQALAAISAANTSPFRLVFGGGTALSRAHGLIRRMSEDIDLKIVCDDGRFSRQALRDLRGAVTSALLEAGFEFDPENTRHRESGNASRYTRYRLPYVPSAEGQGSLRPEIQVEMAVWPLRRAPSDLPVASFIAQAFGPRDAALVRHIYDLHVIRSHYDEAAVIALAEQIMQADSGAYGHQFPAYRGDPIAETLRAAALIASDAGFASRYEVFLRDMVYGELVEFVAAVSSIKALADLLRS